MSGGAALRVHVLIDSLTWGGAEMLLTEFAAVAPATGIELSVGHLQDLNGSPAAARLRQRGIEPVLVPIEGLLKPSDLRRVRRHLAQAAPDVLHTHLGYSDFMGGLAARSLRVPMVSTIHVMESASGLRERTKEWLMDRVRRSCAATVIVPSEAARSFLLARGGDTPQRVVTVHNGVAAEARPGTGAGVRSELGLAREDPVVAMVSVLRAGKGHDVALEAVESLRERFPALRLVIVGEGPARPQIERAAARLGGAVIMTGHRDDVMEVLDAVDILIHPSRFDAFPTSLLEAMAAGVPVVATRVGGIPEIVIDGQSGLLVEPPPTAESLVAAVAPLLGAPDLRRHLGQGGRERFEREFSAERWARRMRRVYEGALAGRR